MQVDVEDRLACVGVAVEDGSEAALAVAMLARQRRSAADHLANEPVVFGGNVVEGRDVAARYHQNMHRRLRVDVLDGNQPIVLVDD